MNVRSRNIFITVISTIIFFYVISLFIDFFLDKQSPAGDIAGKIRTSYTSVSINDQLIPSYEFKNSVYIVAQDLELFNFNIKNDEKTHTIYITKGENSNLNKKYISKLSQLDEEEKVFYPTQNVYINDVYIVSYATKEYNIIPVNALNNIGTCSKEATSGTIKCTLHSSDNNNAKSNDNEFSLTPASANLNVNSTHSSENSHTRVIVLDAGHGKSSSLMSDDEKQKSGWVKKGNSWGEWRHWKSNTIHDDCEGSGCNGRVPDGGSCWYPIINGDRDIEPELNLNNALATKKYLEEMGYTVRLTRSTNDENPSITKRIELCYPNGDTSLSPDADAIVCIHSNAGGGTGSCYMSLSGKYDQKQIPSDYIDASNNLGKAINDKIVSNTSLKASGSGSFDALATAILFCKSPVIVAYMEIGFYDNEKDLEILKNESDLIGKSIAEGIDAYFSN